MIKKPWIVAFWGLKPFSRSLAMAAGALSVLAACGPTERAELELASAQAHVSSGRAISPELSVSDPRLPSSVRHIEV
jgi:hypothetical protein